MVFEHLAPGSGPPCVFRFRHCSSLSSRETVTFLAAIALDSCRALRLGIACPPEWCSKGGCFVTPASSRRFSFGYDVAGVVWCSEYGVDTLPLALPLLVIPAQRAKWRNLSSPLECLAALAATKPFAF